MARQYDSIPDRLRRFIEAQKIFFVATAAPDGRINLSPKGLDTLRVMDPRRVAWLNLTGSGNETAAHLLESPRITLMFTAFEGDPMILRLYGEARAIHRQEAEWTSLSALFPPLPGARQIIDMRVELVQTSCGMGVPLFRYAGQRRNLIEWAEKKGETGIEAYWREKNLLSLDGRPTGMERQL